MRSFSHLEAAAFERLNETVKKARAMASEVNVMSKEQLYMYLEREGLDSDVIETLRSNKISGSSFLELASEHLKELFPVIGDRIAVHKFLEKIKGPSKMDSIASSSKSMVGLHAEYNLSVKSHIFAKYF